MSKKKTATDGLEELAAELNARFGQEAVMMLDTSKLANVEIISTRSIGLDKALGVGGLPRRRITEIYGPEGVGKTTLALHVVSEAQSKGEDCAYIDLEQALDPSYARKLGVDTARLLIAQPSSGDEALQLLEAMVQSKKLGVVVFDSVAAVLPKAEMEGDIGDNHMAGQARLLTQALRKLTDAIGKSGTVVIMINQLRTNIGAYSPNGQVPETTTGGKAVKYWAGIRIDLRRISSIKRGEDVVGARIRAKVVKNKVASPFKVTEYDIVYGEGISREGELIALGEKLGVVKKAGASYSTGTTALGRGYDASRTFLRTHPDIAQALQEAILKKYEE